MSVSPASAGPAAPATLNLETGRVVYVASGVGRGHLMSGAVVTELLRSRGVGTLVVTTCDAAAAFLRAAGAGDPAVLDGGFSLAFDDQYWPRAAATALGLAGYVLRAGAWRDVRHVTRLAGTASVVVNDGHPAPVLARARRACRAGLVQVLSEHTIGAIESAATGWLPAALGRPAARLVDRMLVAADHTIVNTLNADRFFTRKGDVSFLPPIFRAARTPPEVVRQHLGLAAGQPLFVAYLTPHLRGPGILGGLERLAAHHGAFLYVVSEPLAAAAPAAAANRLLVGTDCDLVDKLRAADLFVTTPGLAAPAQALAYGVALVVLLPRNPEQLRNAREIVRWGMGAAAETPAELPAAAERALRADRRPQPALAAAIGDAWLAIIREAARR